MSEGFATRTHKLLANSPFARARRSVSAEDIAAKQALLETERYKLWYPAPPGRKTSVLTDILIERMCQRARAVAEAAAPVRMAIE